MTTLPLAITRGDVADYVHAVIYVYLVLILIWVIASWFRTIPYHPVLSAFLTFVNDVTRPYLNLFRRILPMARIGPAALDLSPLVATIVLLIVGDLVVDIIRG